MVLCLARGSPDSCLVRFVRSLSFGGPLFTSSHVVFHRGGKDCGHSKRFIYGVLCSCRRAIHEKYPFNNTENATFNQFVFTDVIQQGIVLPGRWTIWVSKHMTKFFTLDAHSFQHGLRGGRAKNTITCSPTVICDPRMRSRHHI